MSEYLKKSLLFSSIIFSSFVFLFSCSVGLGESVDTEVPKVEITYPPASRAVRDWFLLAGACSDDKGVDSITVSAENISTNETVEFGTVSPAKDGSWSIRINEKDENGNFRLKDGTYTFCAIAKDSSKQNSAPNYRALEIDNTPPVFVIKNPGTTNGSAPASFGSILKVVGAAADEHEIYELVLSVYDSADMAGEPKAVLSEKNVDKTDGINVTLARYNIDVENDPSKADELHTNYVKLYDVTGGGDQQFYASVTLKDSAEVWQDSKKSQADSIGNSTDGALYLNDSVYDKLMGKNSEYKLTAADFMKLLNGTFNSSASSADRSAVLSSGGVLDEKTQAEILNILSANCTDTLKNPVAFKLNKDANPSYEIMGFSFKSGDIATFGSHKAAKQSSLTFKASAGRDGTSVKPSSLKVYLFGPYDSCTAETLEKIRTEPESFYESSMKEAEEAAKNSMGGGNPTEELVAGFATARIIADYSASGASSTETFTESIELPNTITKGKFYALAASGEDIDGLSLATQNYYGFVGESAGTPPSVLIDGFEDGKMANDLGIVKISGTLSSDETELAGVTYSISVRDEINAKAVGKISGDAELSFGGNKLSATWKIADIQKGSVSLEEGYSSCVPKDGERFKYTVTVSGKDVTGLESKDTKSFEIDRKKPEIKINDVSPVAKKETDSGTGESKYKVNGKIKFSAVVTDTNLLSVKAFVSDADGNNKELYSGGNSTVEAEFDTTEFKDEDFLTFSVTAEDSAGNISVSERKDVFVSQATDNPVVNFTNGTLSSDGISSWDNISNGKNVFGIENNNSANFSLTDDDGIDLVVVSVYDENNKLIGSEGALSIETAQIQKQKNSKDAAENAANPVHYEAGGSTTYSVSYVLPKAAGKYKIKIEVFDTEYSGTGEANKNWHSSAAEGYILVSEGNISISFVDITNNTCQVKADANHKIEGTVSLSTLGKLKSLERFGGVKNTDESGSATWSQADSASSKYPFDASETDETKKITVEQANGRLKWTDTLPGASIADGEQHFFYKATGVDGNSAVIELICYGDGNAPKVINRTDFSKWNKSTAVKLSVLAADLDGFEPSGIANVKYSYKKGETDFSGELARGNKKYTADGKEDDKSGTYYEYSTTVDFDEGSTSISIKAEDNVGNSAEIGPFEVKVDTAAPEKKELKIDANLFKKNTDSVQVSYAFSDLTSGISKIEFCTNRNFKTEDKTYKPVKCFGVKDYGTAEALKTEEISLAGLSDGEYKIYARATDDAGNVSGIEETGSFIVDTTAPVVKITSPVSGSTVNKTISLSGTVVDSNLLKNKTPVLLYKNGSAWTALSASSTLDGQSWTISKIDTTQLNKTETLKEFEFNVQFTDDAENTSEAVSYKLNVDQNSDRPVIKLTNIKISGSAVSSNIVQGVISDDDGVVGNLKLYRIDKTSYESNKKIPSDSGNAWKEVKVESGTGIWKAELAADEAQGAKNWYFYVIDEAGGRFCTTESSPLSRPYISDSLTSEKTDNTEGISFFYDTIAPEVEISVGYDGNTFSETNSIFGGNEEAGKNKIYVRASVTEEVGMASINPVVLFVGGKRLDQTGAYPKCSSSKNENGIVVYTYDFAPVDVSSSEEYKDGSLSISVMAEDSSGLSNKDMLNVTIDKSAPTIKIVSPTTAVSDAVTGSVTIKGIAQDNASSVSKIQYLIPTVDQVALYKSTGKISSGWKEVGNSGSWEIQFASGAAESSDSLLYYVNATEGEKHVYAVESFGAEGENIWKVPIYFKVSDSCGNEAIRTTDKDGKALYVLVDPEGGKPKVWVNSPEENSTTSGLVTVYGGASDDVSVARVELQFDANGDGKIDFDDFTVINNDSGVWAGTAVKENLKGSGDDWYILANGTNSWKVPVDTDKIAASSGGKKFIFRVRAFDGDGKTRGWSNVVTVKIDSEVPVIKDLKVVQFGKGETVNSSSVSGLTPVSEREYLSGMYISNIMEKANGTFYLVGTITDNSCVKSVTFEKQTTASSVNNIDLGLTDVTDNSGKEYNLCVPLKTDVSGQINYIIKAHDDNTGETSQSVVINIDSTKPGMYTTGGAESESIGSSLRLKSLGENLGTESGNSTVVNSDGYFTFGDTVSEAGSGLAFVVAVFERSGTVGGRRIYNPMKKDTKLSLAENETESSASGKPYISTEGFAVLSFDVERPSEDSIQSAKFAESANAAFIQKGGLVRIAGTYCLITDFDSSAGKITLSKSVSDKFKKAEIIFGQVIDHQIVETFKPDGTVENDDGDGMCETIRQLGASYTWTASVDSTNIPDGPVTVHVVAIDNAGNTNCGSIATKVENNRPRIAKVMLATDLNGNGKFDYDASSAPVTGDTAETLNERTSDGAAFGEFSFYSGMKEKSTNLLSEVKLGSSGFKVIEKLAVLPEFVGGNGNIGYILETAANSSSLDSSSKAEGSVINLTAKSELVAGGKFADKPTNPSGVTYKDLISEKGGIVLDSVLSGYLSFTFWDSTEETTPGQDSQWAHLKIPVTVLSEETEKPVPAISPFYWNSKTDNSVKTDSDGNVFGHIELEGDLTSEIIAAYDDDSSSMKKPKVSGKIKIEGTVKDNVRLGSISMGFDGLFTAATIATYKNGDWTNSELPNGVESVEVKDVYISQAGHEAKFTVVVDTEKLSDVAAKGKSITVSATDWKVNTSAASAAQTTAAAKTALYTVDVVPYVTGVGTDLSEFYRSAPSVYARTARGKYPVNENETITLKGFNLGTSPKVELSGVELVMNGSGLSYNIGEVAKSGKLEVTVSEIKALNNLNSDSAEYNKQPNGVNNNTLNDNLEFDVWEFKAAATAKNGPILQPHMKVSPAGQLGFSYANATLYFNMPGVASDGTSYAQTPFGRNFGGFTQNAFTYDSAGNAYGVALCPDTSGEAGMSANLQFFSRTSALYGNEGGGDLNNNYYNQTNARRIENTSIKLDGSSITQNINRILSPSMATYTENGTTYVYVAYYDELSRQVRFRVGSVETSENNIGMGLVDLAGSGVTGRVDGSNDDPKLNKNTTRDSISGYITEASSTETIDVSSVTKDIYVRVASSDGYNHIHAWGGYSTGVAYPGVKMPLVDGYYVFKMPNTSSTMLILNNGNDGDSNKAGGGNLSITSSGVYEWNGSRLAKLESGTIKYQAPASTMPSYDGYKYCQVVAASGVSGGTAEYASATSKRAGQYVAVGSLSDGTAVMAWYDSGSGRLSFSYNESPRTAQASLDSGTATWQNNSYYVSDANIRAGTYVSMAVDNANGIHLAYYSATGGDLYYTYIAAPKTKTVTKTVIVDSYGSVGTYTMIDVARNDENGTFVPYISYRCESNSDTTASVKIAYPVFWDTTGNVLIGVDSSDRYTGNWEVSVVPTDNTPLSDYTNVGLNKNSNGVRQAFAEGSDTSKSWSAIFAVSDSTIVYGNGTSNPVVSYAVSENGVLEMAQKK